MCENSDVYIYDFLRENIFHAHFIVHCHVKSYNVEKLCNLLEILKAKDCDTWKRQ